MTSYRVDVHPSVQKALEKLPRPLAERIIGKIYRAAEDPFRYLERLEDVSTYKLRTGDYRAIIDIDTSTRTLLIQAVGHRSRIYKR